jgi:hypothetical protein
MALTAKATVVLAFEACETREGEALKFEVA